MRLYDILKKIIQNLNNKVDKTVAGILLGYQNFTPSIWDAWAYKQGRVCWVEINTNPNGSIPARTWVEMTILPNGYRPLADVLITSANQSNGSVLWQIIAPSGVIRFWSAGSTDAFSRMSFCFITSS